MKFFIPIFFTLSAVIIYCFPNMTELLEYNRELIFRGEYWRLVTGHFTHCSLDHLFWDTVTFAILSFICCRKSIKLYLLMITVSSLFISIVILIMNSEIMIYRGLSGIDTALFFFAAYSIATKAVKNRDKLWTLIGCTLLILPVIKTLYEYFTGNLLFTNSSNFLPLPGVHLAGIVICCIIIIINDSHALFTYFQSKQSPVQDL